MRNNYAVTFIRIIITYVFVLQSFSLTADPVQSTLKLATFDTNATPPIGSSLTNDPMVNTVSQKM